jgi:transposase
MRSIGLDIHTRFAEIAILDGTDPPISRRIGTTTSELRAFARTLRADDQLVLEATMNTWAIADLLRESGARVVISNPLRTRAIAEATVKTATVDALMLAQLLAGDVVPEVWTPVTDTQRLRREVAGRAALVRQRTQVGNRIHAVLHRCLEDAPVTDLFGVAGQAWLTELALPEDERAHVEAALRVHEAIEAEIALVEQRLANVALADERVERLLTIPGIGATTARSIVAVIGAVQRFRRPGKLVSDLGVDPKVRQSGEHAAWIGHTSAGPGTPTREASSSRPRTLRSALRGRSGRSSAGSSGAAASRSRSSRSRASSPCLRGTSSATASGTASSAPRSCGKSGATSSGNSAVRLRGAGAPQVSRAASPCARRSSYASPKRRPGTRPRSPRARQRTRPPPLGKRQYGPRKGKMRGGACVPDAPLFSRGRPRPRTETPQGLDSFIRMGAGPVRRRAATPRSA